MESSLQQQLETLTSVIIPMPLKLMTTRMSGVNMFNHVQSDSKHILPVTHTYSESERNTFISIHISTLLDFLDHDPDHNHDLYRDKDMTFLCLCLTAILLNHILKLKFCDTLVGGCWCQKCAAWEPGVVSSSLPLPPRLSLQLAAEPSLSDDHL